MNFTSYVDRQRQAVRAAQFDEVAFACGREVLPACAAAGADGSQEQRGAAQYFERLSAKLFEELDVMRGFRREEGEVCC